MIVPIAGGDRARDAFRVTHPPFCRFSTYTLLRFFIGLCLRQPNYEVVARKDTHTNQWRPSDSRKKITTSKRFDLKFFRVLSKNRHPGILLWCLCSQECGKGLLVYAERIRTYNTALPSSALCPSLLSVQFMLSGDQAEGD